MEPCIHHNDTPLLLEICNAVVQGKLLIRAEIGVTYFKFLTQFHSILELQWDTISTLWPAIKTQDILIDRKAFFPVKSLKKLITWNLELGQVLDIINELFPEKKLMCNNSAVVGKDSNLFFSIIYQRIYQRTHLFSRFIGVPAPHLNSRTKSSLFDSVPITR